MVCISVMKTPAALILMAVMTVVVILDLMVMDFIAVTQMNVLQMCHHVIPMPLVKIHMVHLFVNVTLDSLVMVLLVMHLMTVLNLIMIMECGNVLLDSPAMNLTVKISTNVMTHHVQPTQVVQTLWDPFTAHVTMVTLVMDLIAVISMNVTQVHVSMRFAITMMVVSVVVAKLGSLLAQARLIASMSMNAPILTLVAPIQNAGILLVLLPVPASMDIVSKAQNFYTSSITLLTSSAANHVTVLMSTSVSLMFVITMRSAPITSAHTRANVMMDLMVMVLPVTTVTNVDLTPHVTKVPFV